MSANPQAPLDVEWSMTVADRALRVDYVLTNRGDRQVHVFDCLLVKGEKPGTYRRAPGKAVVMEGDPGTAMIWLGTATPSNPMAFVAPPLVRPLAAGASVKGSFQLPLPLAPWHNVGWAAPFTAEPKTATLGVQYFLAEPEWFELPSETGEKFRVPKKGDPRNAISGPKPIPHA